MMPESIVTKYQSLFTDAASAKIKCIQKEIKTMPKLTQAKETR